MKCICSFFILNSPGLRQHFDEELLAKRNRRMAGRIAEKLRASPDKSHFYALGAMHYVGQSSVLEAANGGIQDRARPEMNPTVTRVLVSALTLLSSAGTTAEPATKRALPGGTVIGMPGPASRASHH